jgi:hypothetical protein
LAHKEIGFQQVEKFIKEVAPWAHPDAPPKLVGKGINLMISPLPRNKRAKNPNQTPRPMVETHEEEPEEEDEVEETTEAESTDHATSDNSTDADTNSSESPNEPPDKSNQPPGASPRSQP